MDNKQLLDAIRSETKYKYTETQEIIKLCMEADSRIEALTTQLAESDRQRAAAVNEICAQCKPSQIVDGVAFYDCNGCKWRGPQEVREGGG